MGVLLAGIGQRGALGHSRDREGGCWLVEHYGTKPWWHVGSAPRTVDARPAGVLLFPPGHPALIDGLETCDCLASGGKQSPAPREGPLWRFRRARRWTPS